MAQRRLGYSHSSSDFYWTAQDGITYDELYGSGIGETGLGERSVAISNGTKTAPASI